MPRRSLRRGCGRRAIGLCGLACRLLLLRGCPWCRRRGTCLRNGSRCWRRRASRAPSRFGRDLFEQFNRLGQHKLLDRPSAMRTHDAFGSQKDRPLLQLLHTIAAKLVTARLQARVCELVEADCAHLLVFVVGQLQHRLQHVEGRHHDCRRVRHVAALWLPHVCRGTRRPPPPPKSHKEGPEELSAPTACALIGSKKSPTELM